jgi:hypothetical protein
VSSSSIGLGRIATGAAFLAVGALWAAAALGADAADAGDKSLAQQIFEAMAQDPGTKPGYRVAHAKRIVCEGTFAPSAGAAKLSKAAHFQRGSVPVTIRFSDGSADLSSAKNPLRAWLDQKVVVMESTQHRSGVHDKALAKPTPEVLF